MKMKLLMVMLMTVLAIGQVQANYVPNGDFQTMLKPGEPTVTATVADGAYWSIPTGTIKGGGPASYSDGTTGDFIDTPGWAALDGTNSDCMIGGGWGGPDGAGDVAFLAFGGWGGPTTITSAAPLSIPVTETALQLSADIFNHGGPVILNLLADGVKVMPDAESSPALVQNDWVEFTRAYNSVPAGVLTVEVGTRDEDGTGWTGNRVSIDNVTLIPEPATMLLLGIGGLGLLRRKRR